jgi:cytochrome c-type biogenesis protein CcmF
MVVELGHFALVLALMVALVQMVLPMWGAQRGQPALMAVAGPAAVVQFLLVATAFGALTWAFVTCAWWSRTRTR